MKLLLVSDVNPRRFGVEINPIKGFLVVHNDDYKYQELMGLLDSKYSRTSIDVIPVTVKLTDMEPNEVYNQIDLLAEEYNSIVNENTELKRELDTLKKRMIQLEPGIEIKNNKTNTINDSEGEHCSESSDFGSNGNDSSRELKAVFNSKNKKP